MTCHELQQELVGFHFGVLERPVRAEVEAHVVGCTSCLQAYLGLKRDVETGEGAQQPSMASRERLRRAVGQALHVEPVTPWRWERPFAFGIAGLAVWFALVTTHLVATGAAVPPHAVQEASTPAP